MRGQFDRLRSLASNPGTNFRVGIQTGRSVEVLSLSIQKGGPADYPHLRIVRESTGEVVHMLWGWRGLLPTIKMTDGQGNLIRGYNGEWIEVGFGDVKGAKGRQGLDWIAIGVKVAAVAFALWLGASVGKAILSAVAFLALNAMVLGLLVAAFAVVAPAIDWLLKNITLEDVENFFSQLVNDIIRVFTEISQMLDKWLK